MNLFDRIKDKLGIREKQASDANPDVTPLPGGAESTIPDQRPTATRNATTGTDQALSSAPVRPTLDAIDVTALLDQRASDHPERLNWRTSIVDLLKLLELDSSLQSRRTLATELGYDNPQSDDTAQMNVWLHREVMRRLAEHGGQVPPELQ